MNLTRLDGLNFIDLAAIARVRIESFGDDATAFLRYQDGGSDELAGEAARMLCRLLESGGDTANPKGSAKPPESASGTPAAGAVRQPVRLGTLVIDQPTSWPHGRKKGWFYRKDDNGKGYILAFVNAKGSCSIRTFDSETGVFRGKHTEPGNYQDQFADLIEGATELTIGSQPNLERDCKERLPDQVLGYLRDQID